MLEKIKDQLKKFGVMTLVFGGLYIIFDVVYRAIFGEGIGIMDNSYWGFMGFSSIWMIPIAGFCGALLGIFNEIKWVKTKVHMLIKTIVSAVIVCFFEYLFGYFVNVILGQNIWNYEGSFLSIDGQTCFRAFIFWILFAPLVFWIDDFLRYTWFGEEKPESITVYYSSNFKFKK